MRSPHSLFMRQPPHPLQSGGFELTEQKTESVEHVITALKTHRGIILAGGMGSGKSVQASTWHTRWWLWRSRALHSSGLAGASMWC